MQMWSLWYGVFNFFNCPLQHYTLAVRLVKYPILALILSNLYNLVYILMAIDEQGKLRVSNLLLFSKEKCT